MQTVNLLSEDLAAVFNLTADLWKEMRGENLFITGGTGFFGCWILETFLYANEKLDLNSSVVVLTRNSAAFEKKAPHLAFNPAVSFVNGDVNSFEFPEKEFKFLIHAATDVYGKSSPTRTIETIYEGTRRVLDFAKYCKARKVLLTSSGAIYGRQPVSLSHVGEDYAGAPDVSNPNSAYGEGKRMSELLAAIYAAENDFEIKIARCFAFVGPYLQLDGHLAVGNFICDVLDGKTIRINGDGSPLRSYMYASDLAVWLWTILFSGKSARPYNVGSERETSLADLAKIISAIGERGNGVEIAQKPTNLPPERYVPQTRRAFDELDLRLTVDLETALRKTIDYYANANEGD